MVDRKSIGDRDMDREMNRDMDRDMEWPLRSVLPGVAILLLAGALGLGSQRALASAAGAPQGFPEESASVESDLAEYDPLFDDQFGFEDAEVDLSEVDPFEKTNRYLFSFNRGVDAVFWKPLTSVYRLIVPSPARRAVRRAFHNARAPAVMMNHLLQGRVRDAGETVGSFLLNATAGVGGLLDAATEAGWELGNEDFGQTLARAGVASGPYIVVPVFGPNTVRDGVGSVVDLAFDPTTYLLGPIQGLFISGPNGFTAKDEVTDDLEALEETSVDFYAALRSAYLQTREALIREPEEPTLARNR